MAFDLTQVQEMKKYAEFGAAVVELAKEAGIIPRRPRVVVRTKVKTRVVVRKPRQKKAEAEMPPEQTLS